MNSMAGCEIMVAMITIFVGMATAMQLVSRPSFGTIFAHTIEIKNYGAQWFVHLHVETLPDNLMPDSNLKSLSDMSTFKRVGGYMFLHCLSFGLKTGTMQWNFRQNPSKIGNRVCK